MIVIHKARVWARHKDTLSPRLTVAPENLIGGWQLPIKAAMEDLRKELTATFAEFVSADQVEVQFLINGRWEHPDDYVRHQPPPARTLHIVPSKED